MVTRGDNQHSQQKGEWNAFIERNVLPMVHIYWAVSQYNLSFWSIFICQLIQYLQIICRPYINIDSDGNTYNTMFNRVVENDESLY